MFFSRLYSITLTAFLTMLVWQVVNDQIGFTQVTRASTADSQMQSSNEDKPLGYLNWKTATFGGKQFWTDQRFYGGWRIQINSETGHYRLLDPNDVRHAWGNYPHCEQTLNKLIADGTVKPTRGKVIILLHGLIRTASSMDTLANHFEKQGGYTPINFHYASTRKNVENHARSLKRLVEDLGPEVTEINFVGHSLGNLVVRKYLYLAWDPLKGVQGDARIRRMVMIGPPNQGSRMAKLLKNSMLFKSIAGVSGMQLAAGWNKLEPTLATPRFQFGIIAGGQEGDADLSNFVLKGKDDFTVSVTETKLDGAHDFLVKPLLHSTMMTKPKTLKAALNFIQHGYFVSEEARQPIKPQSGQ